MKIVVTARNYDQTCIDYMKKEGFQVEVYKNSLEMSEEQLYECVKDADGVIVGIEPFTRSLIARLPKLKVISRRGIGYDSIDTKALSEFNIELTRTLGAVEAPVAEQVMAYILYFARRVDGQSQLLKSGVWRRDTQFGLRGRTLGLIGFGGIGKEIAKRALPFDVKVIATSHHDEVGSVVDGVTIVNEDELLTNSDFVSINIPLREDTYHYADADFFRKMKPGSYFINIARGKVMDVAALMANLDSGHLAGCATDVFDYEPCTDSPLAKYGDNVIITPHSCPMTYYDQYAMDYSAAQNTIAALRKKQ